MTIGPIYDITQILEDPHVIERELVADYPDADMGTFPMHHVVPRLSARPARSARPRRSWASTTRKLLEDSGFKGLRTSKN